MARTCTATINLSAIKHNYQYAKSLAPNSKAIAIIKANAYGHGAVEVAEYLEDCADAFGVACTEEAIEIRKAGIEKRPILLLEGVFEACEMALLEKHGLIPVIGSLVQLRWLLEVRLKQPITVFLKYDSGMSRLGFHEDGFKQALHALESSSNVAEIVLMTHFSRADEPYDIYTQNQIDNFNRIAKEAGHPSSIANSAGIVAWRNSHKQYNRPGIMLYGSPPFCEVRYQKNLVPAMTFSSVLISIKNFKKGQGIGYGSRFVCKKDMQIGVVAVGYADGYSRHAKDGTPVFINGSRASIAGRVSMDMITIDLTGVNNPTIGDRVEMFGENININEVAESSGTISYEILTKITRRVYKQYIK